MIPTHVPLGVLALLAGPSADMQQIVEFAVSPKTAAFGLARVVVVGGPSHMYMTRWSYGAVFGARATAVCFAHVDVLEPNCQRTETAPQRSELTEDRV